MQQLFNKDSLLKAGLMFALSLMITVMIAPNLSLVPARYEEGDIIPETIIIPDDLTLVDERSTEARMMQHLAEFPPIFDFDTRLKNKTIKAIQGAFQAMRDQLATGRKNQVDVQERIRQNSLSHIETLAAINFAKERVKLAQKQRRHIIEQIGSLTDKTESTDRDKARLEKLRFDLKANKALRQSAQQGVDQLKAKIEQLGKDATGLKGESSRMISEEGGAQTNLMKEFERKLNISLDETTFKIFLDSQFSPDLEQKTISLILPAYDRFIIASRENLGKDLTAIQMRPLESEKLERFENLESIVDVPQVRAQINETGAELKFPGDGGPYREAVIALAQRLVEPNLTENKGETERQKQELVKNLSPVYFSLKKGDVVARAGNTAKAQQVEIIRALTTYNLTNPKYPQIIGTFLIVLLSLGLVYQLIAYRNPSGTISISRLLLMSLLLVVTLLAAQAILLVVPALSTVYDAIPPSTYNYLIPAALTSMLAGIVLGFEVAVFLGFITSLCLAILLGNSLPFFLFSLVGSLVSAIPIRQYESRFALWQQGWRISGVNVTMLLVLSLLEQEALDMVLVLNLGAALMNGLGVALLTATLLPLIEILFDITTNLKLLELSNMNHPALKELAVRAPGTYHHSIVVGNLSETSAEGIRANPLLVRVASYYHDLGKMLCPLYFVENQQKRNYHDDLPAKTSARIIINHVKDGLEIARRFKLGKAITDIISQHHGDSLVRYFFHKSKEEHSELDLATEEDDFRYSGPKPQTKEAGLVMVADVTEAATRSLNDPSLESIRKMVQQLTTRIYMEGQLDESGMTFNDLNYIEKTFTKMLISIHHHRISYPEIQVGTREIPQLETGMTPPVKTIPESGETDGEDKDNLDERIASS